MKRVGLYLNRPCFAHGQLYVAMSRVSKPQDITIYLDKEKKEHGIKWGVPYTANVVYRSLLQDEIQKYKESDDFQGDDLFDEGNSFIFTLKHYYMFYSFL